METQIDKICNELKKYHLDDRIHDVYKFDNSRIEEKYGEIKLVRVKLNNSGGTNLLVVPGYSFNSFAGILRKLFEGIQYIDNKYSNLYLVNWGDKIKADSQRIGEGKSQEEKFLLNDLHRNELAILLDKCLRSPDLDLKNITLLGKSAGGGVAICLCNIDKGIHREIKLLLLVAPGLTDRGGPLNDRKELPIHISWNKDDDVIPFAVSEEYEKKLSDQGNNVKIYIYETGGHELNVQFLIDTQEF